MQCSVSPIDTSGEYLIATCSRFPVQSPLLRSAPDKQTVWRNSSPSTCDRHAPIAKIRHFDGANMTARLLVWTRIGVHATLSGRYRCSAWWRFEGAVCASACYMLREENSLTICFLESFAILSREGNKPTILPKHSQDRQSVLPRVSHQQGSRI